MMFFCSFFRIIMLREPRMEKGLLTSWRSLMGSVDGRLLPTIISCSSFSSRVALSSMCLLEESPMLCDCLTWLFFVWMSMSPPLEDVFGWVPSIPWLCGFLLLSSNESFIIPSLTWLLCISWAIPAGFLKAPTESPLLVWPYALIAKCCLSKSLLTFILASVTDLFFLFIICIILFSNTVFSLSMSLCRLSYGLLQWRSRPFGTRCTNFIGAELSTLGFILDRCSTSCL